MGLFEDEIALWAFIAFCNFCLYKFFESLYHVRSLYSDLCFLHVISFSFHYIFRIVYWVNIKQVHRLYGNSVNSSPTIFKLENDPRTVDLLPIIFTLKSLKRLVMIQMFTVKHKYTISWMEVFQIDL